MSLVQVQHYNDLSPELRSKLEEKVKSFGKTVRYKFNISSTNPDPTKYNGDKVWPSVYTVDPTKFTLTDPYEKREGKSKTKTIALIDNINDDGKADRFKKVRITEPEQGIKVLYLEERPEDFEMAMLLELHPKNENGMFPDKSKHQVFHRIDETSLANEERKERSARKLAMDTAEKMSDAEICEFADAMLWDSSQQIGVLRNMAEDLAEKEPNFFNDIIADKKTKYLSTIKKCIDNRFIAYDPADGKLSFASTGQPIVVLGANAGEGGWHKYAEWFLTAGDKADNVYKKLQGMLKKQPELS